MYSELPRFSSAGIRIHREGLAETRAKRQSYPPAELFRIHERLLLKRSNKQEDDHRFIPAQDEALVYRFERLHRVCRFDPTQPKDMASISGTHERVGYGIDAR